MSNLHEEDEKFYCCRCGEVIPALDAFMANYRCLDCAGGTWTTDFGGEADEKRFAEWLARQ